MEFPKNQHFLNLRKSHELVGNKTWDCDEFQEDQIEKSRSLLRKKV